MFKVFYFLAVLVLVLAGIPLRAVSQVQISVDSVCLQKAARKISLNTKITVVIQDGSEVKGRLVSIDLAQSHLTFQPSEQTLSLYRISRVEKIQYRKIGPESVAKGVLLGALVGGIAGLPLLLADGDDEGFLDFSGVSRAVGAGFIVAGAGLGLVVGFTQPTTHAIQCK